MRQKLMVKEHTRLLVRKWLSTQIFRLIKFILIGLLTLILTTGWMPTVLGQIPKLPAPKPVANAQTPSPPLVGQLGNIVFLPVKLDGRNLFRVASVNSERVDGENVDSPLKRRVKLIEKKLYQIIQTDFNPETLQVNVGELNSQVVILVSDEEQKQLTNLPLVTVTLLDARLYGLPISKWAPQLATIIHTALIQAEQERQPDYLLKQGLISGGLLFGAILAGLGLAAIQKRLQVQIEALRKEQSRSVSDSATEAEVETSEDAAIATQLKESSQKRQIQLKILQRWLLRIARLMILLGVLAWIVGQFPWTREFQHWLLKEPLRLLGIALVTIVVMRSVDYFIQRSFAVLAEREFFTATNSRRQGLRFSTFSGVLRGLTSFFIIGFGILVGLQVLNIPVGPVLAGAGIVGLGISFASQNLIKDVINGTLILLEDQYAMGDVIRVAGVAGLVEKMNLRITQLRTVEGILVTVPHATVNVVENMSKDWSRVNFSVEVGYDTDVGLALQVLKEVAEEMYQDPQWKGQILNPLDTIGVNQIAHTGIQCMLRIKTEPGKQWVVEREFRHRLKLAFDRHNIQIGIPQRINILAEERPKPVSLSNSENKANKE
jgi:small conductance mechanosensitive channel